MTTLYNKIIYYELSSNLSPVKSFSDFFDSTASMATSTTSDNVTIILDGYETSVEAFQGYMNRCLENCVGSFERTEKQCNRNYKFSNDGSDDSTLNILQFYDRMEECTRDYEITSDGSDATTPDILQFYDKMEAYYRDYEITGDGSGGNAPEKHRTKCLCGGCYFVEHDDAIIPVCEWYQNYTGESNTELVEKPGFFTRDPKLGKQSKNSRIAPPQQGFLKKLPNTVRSNHRDKFNRVRAHGLPATDNERETLERVKHSQKCVRSIKKTHKNKGKGKDKDKGKRHGKAQMSEF